MVAMAKRNQLLIRTGLTAAEWARIRRLAVGQDVTAKKLVTDWIRESLQTIEGAKP